MSAVRITLYTLALLALAPAAGARPPSPDDGAHPDRALARLGLDDSTRASVDALVEEGRAELEAQRDEVRAARTELREQMEAEAPEEAAVMPAAAELAALEQAALETRLRTLLAVRALLTPAQRRALGALHDERRGVVEDACREDALSSVHRRRPLRDH